MSINLPLHELDLTNITQKVAKKNDWTPEFSEQAELMYRGFLYLSLYYPDKELVPTTAIDEMWHTHILDTQKYMNDCDKIFGAYFHHIPSYDVNGPEVSAPSQGFVETKSLFMAELGIDISGTSGTCGGNTSCRSKVTAEATCGGQTGCKTRTSEMSAAGTCGGNTSCRSKISDALKVATCGGQTGCKTRVDGVEPKRRKGHKPPTKTLATPFVG